MFEANGAAKTTQRLQHIANVLGAESRGDTGTSARTALRFEPDIESFPTRKELPAIPGAPAGAAWFWGESDNLGRLNLVTPKRVLAAPKGIKTGEIVPLNLPLDIPKHPAFMKGSFQHQIKCLAENIAYDDLYTMNTQSGTQWDGFRHFSHLATGSFHNNIHGADIMGPNETTSAVSTTGPTTGGDIRVGDLLLIQSGFVEAYRSKSEEERKTGGLREHNFGPDDGQRWTGVAQEEEMLDLLHDCYFAGVAGDAPTFEAWPSESYYIHECLLALWGCPLGEMWGPRAVGEEVLGDRKVGILYDQQPSEHASWCRESCERHGDSVRPSSAR